jgi:tryptophan synthase alpha chain
MVAYYPDRDGSLEVAAALIDGGSAYLEIQFPFSDPTADGPVIQTACTRALEQGFTVESGFELVSSIRKRSDIPIFLMCYANTVFFHNVESFLDRCARSGAQGIIVPDLPHDYDENLYSLAGQRELWAVPVVAPSAKDERLRSILHLKPFYLYAALRTGITGQETEIGEDNISFLRKILESSGDENIRILAGFGVSKSEQIASLAPHVHATIVGSALIRTIMEDKEKAIYKTIKKKIDELMETPPRAKPGSRRVSP